MSARLIGELVEWLRTPAAADLSPRERIVLFVVAERAHERTRLMLRHRVDDIQLVDRLAQATGMDRDGALKRALRALAKRGLDVRVPVGEGKDGRPVFTFEGHSMRFRLPDFPASVELPERPAKDTGPVDNPVDEPVDNPPNQDQDDVERGTESSRLSARGVRNRPASQDERGTESSRPTPSNYLDDPSTSSSPSHPASLVAEPVSGLGPRDPAAENQDQSQPQRRFTHDFRSACALILGLDPETQARAEEMARARLGPDATHEQIRIRMAEIATEGIPA